MLNVLLKEWRTALLATEGLISYRRGEISRGRSGYKEAIEAAIQIRNDTQIVWVHLYQAREEYLIGNREAADQLIASVAERIKKLPQRDRAATEQILKNVQSAKLTNTS